MKVIRVQYTIKEDFVEKNKENVSRVMEELKATGNTDVKYAYFQHEDGKTFMHVVMYKNVEAESLPSSLPAFAEFQKELKENLEGDPKVEKFSLIDASFDVF